MTCPREVLLEIFDWLAPASLSRCLKVSRAFCQAAIHARFRKMSIGNDVSSYGLVPSCELDKGLTYNCFCLNAGGLGRTRA